MARPPVRWGRFTVWALTVALSIAFTMTFVSLALGRSLTDALTMGGLWGVFQALFQSWNSLRHRREVLEGAPSDLTTEQQRQALDAAHHGPLPEDPAVLAEALRVAQAQAAALGTTSPKKLAVVFGATGLGLAAVGIFASHWWIAVGACFAGLGSLAGLRGTQVTRRVTVLGEAAARAPR